MKRDRARIIAWSLVGIMLIVTAISFWRGPVETGGLAVVTYQETPTVLMPAAALDWGLFSAQQIETYLAKYAPKFAGKGVGTAIMAACTKYRYLHQRPGETRAEYMVLRPDIVVSLMLHESGGAGFGLPPWNNPFSWNITSNWRNQPASSYTFSSIPACVQFVISTGLRSYLQDGGSHNHGPSLQGMAVAYVGGMPAAEHDASWVAGITRWDTRYQAMMTSEQRALLSMLSTETFRPSGTGGLAYLDAPISRRELAQLLYRQAGGK